MNGSSSLLFGASFKRPVTQSKYAFDLDKYLSLAAKGELLDEACIKVICAKVREVLA